MTDQSDKEALAAQLRGYHGVPHDEDLNAMSNIELDSLLHSSKNNPVKSAAIEREIQRRRSPKPPSLWLHPLTKWALGIVSGVILLIIGWVIKN